MKVQVYLNFDGDSKEAFEFYRSIFGGEFLAAIAFKDFPMEGVSVPPEEEDRIMHIALPLGSDSVLMATDALPSMGQEVRQGNNVYISLQVDSRKEADRIFSSLAEGGEVEMPIADQAWDAYSGSLKDRFGVLWMVNHTNAAVE